MRIIAEAAFTVLFILCLTSIVLPVAASTSNSTNTTVTGPARIELRADRSHVTADEADYITLTAHVYDAHGNPAPDGTQVNFTVGNDVSNAYTGGFTWSPDNGSLMAPPGSGIYISFTEGGIANASYGWVYEPFGGNNSTIWAYVNGTNIYSMAKIYSAAPGPSLTGRVVDSHYNGVGGIPVTLHAMGYQYNDTPYEIYNMTRITEVRSPSVGNFSFDCIVFTGNTYSYVDTKAVLANNTTVYGKSDNFSMNWSNMSIGAIVLETPSQVTIVASSYVKAPSASAKPTPGFNVVLAFSGLLSVAYVIARKVS